MLLINYLNIIKTNYLFIKKNITISMSINRIRKLNDEINSLFRFDDGEFMANGSSNNDLLGSGYSRGIAMRSNSFNDSGKLGY